LSAGNYQLELSESHHHGHDHHHDHDHDHDHHDHSHGDESGMSIVMSVAESASEDQLTALAEQVFVQFSDESESIKHGQALAQTNKHYRLELEGHETYKFDFSINENRSIALFTGHAPEGLSLKLLSSDNSQIKPTWKKSFHSDHSHDSKVGSTSVELPGLFDGGKLNAWLEEFLIENGPDVYRMKGVVGIDGQEYKS